MRTLSFCSPTRRDNFPPGRWWTLQVKLSGLELRRPRPRLVSCTLLAWACRVVAATLATRSFGRPPVLISPASREEESPLGTKCLQLPGGDRLLDPGSDFPCGSASLVPTTPRYDAIAGERTSAVPRKIVCIASRSSVGTQAGTVSVALRPRVGYLFQPTFEVLLYGP